jgi:hypothetical protein
MQFGPGASMMDPNFWIRLTKGWEEADLQAEGAQTWFGAMVGKQVNMGTTLGLLWIAKCGSEAAQRDPDRRYVPPMALTRQRAMVVHVGERPDWDIRPGVFDPAHCEKALEKHQTVTRILHEAGGLVVGGTDCGGGDQCCQRRRCPPSATAGASWERRGWAVCRFLAGGRRSVT